MAPKRTVDQKTSGKYQYHGTPGGGGQFGLTANQMTAQILAMGATPTGAVTRTAQDQAAAVGHYGGSLAGSIAKQFVGARAASVQAAVITSAKQGELTASKKTVDDVVGIMKGGAQQQAVAASLAKARAVQEATGASDSQTAAFAMELAKMKYAAQLQANADKRAAAAASDQVAQQYGMEYGPQINALTTLAPGLSVQAAEKVRQAISDNGGYKDLDVTTLQTDILQGMNLSADSPQGQYVATFVQNMAGGQLNAGEAVGPTMYQLYGSMPGFETWGGPGAATIVSTSQAAVVDAYVDPSKQDPIDTATWGSAFLGGTSGATPEQQASGNKFWSSFHTAHPELYD